MRNFHGCSHKTTKPCARYIHVYTCVIATLSWARVTFLVRFRTFAIYTPACLAKAWPSAGLLVPWCIGMSLDVSIVVSCTLKITWISYVYILRSKGCFLCVIYSLR